MSWLDVCPWQSLQFTEAIERHVVAKATTQPQERSKQGQVRKMSDVPIERDGKVNNKMSCSLAVNNDPWLERCSLSEEKLDFLLENDQSKCYACVHLDILGNIMNICSHKLLILFRAMFYAYNGGLMRVSGTCTNAKVNVTRSVRDKSRLLQKKLYILYLNIDISKLWCIFKKRMAHEKQKRKRTGNM